MSGGASLIELFSDTFAKTNRFIMRNSQTLTHYNDSSVNKCFGIHVYTNKRLNRTYYLPKHKQKKRESRYNNFSKSEQKAKQAEKSPTTIQFIYDEINTKFKRTLVNKRKNLQKKASQLKKINCSTHQIRGQDFEIIQKSTSTFQDFKAKEIQDIKTKYKVIKIDAKKTQEEKKIVNNFQVLTITRMKPESNKHIRPEKIKMLKKNSVEIQRNQIVKSIKNINHGIKKQSKIEVQNTTEKKIHQQKKPLTNQSIVFYVSQNQKYILDCQSKKFVFTQQIQGQAFTIIHCKDSILTCLYSHNTHIQLQIASLTKTMTCFLVLLISQKFNINLKQQMTKISQKASLLRGTSAKLLYSDIISIFSLLYAMMLPSGNDAAVALAQWAGKTIKNHCRKNIHESSSARNRKAKILDIANSNKRSNISLFVYHMNKVAKQLRLKNTQFANVHGLMNKKNYSCAQDIAKLSYQTMKRRDFRQIVSTKSYKCIIQNRKYGNSRELIWFNTNKLLNIQNYGGVKTGITPSAGPCLSSCYIISPTQQLYIVLLKTQSAQHRFLESKRLLIEALKHLFSIESNKIYLSHLNSLNKKLQIDSASSQTPQDSNNFEVQQEDDFAYEDEKNSQTQF